MPSPAHNFAAHRGIYGAALPPAVVELPLPPQKLKLLNRGRLRKQWRYVAIHSPEVQLCAATINVGPARQTFWAVWDRERQELFEGSHTRNVGVETPEGRLLISDGDVNAEFDLSEVAGVETITPAGRAWAWTRKQGGIAATGVITVPGKRFEVTAPAIIDDSAGYHDRNTDWRWCSGVGKLSDGRDVAWNFVNGIHDTPGASEQTVWVDGNPFEVNECRISTDLSNTGFPTGERLDFHEEVVRSHYENKVVLRSRYSQPFGKFSGRLPFAGSLASGLGVMETHSVVW